MKAKIKPISHKKGDLSITIKSMFAIFIVIFVAFIAFEVVKSRTTFIEEREHFSYYEKVNSFLISLLSSKCLISDYEMNNYNYQSERTSYLSAEKLFKRHGENQDIYCVENFDFMYTLDIEDLSGGSVSKSWRLGLSKEPDWAEREITVSLPVAIGFSGGDTHPGRAILKAYIGNIPRFYGAIKLVCNTKDEASYELSTKHEINYDNNTNMMCVGDQCFFPYFSCRVNPFSIGKGKHLVYISFNKTDQTLNVVV